jgi:hypothetical protein
MTEVKRLMKDSHVMREQNEEKIMKEMKEIESFDTIRDEKERWKKAKTKDGLNERTPFGSKQHGRFSSMF